MALGWKPRNEQQSRRQDWLCNTPASGGVDGEGLVFEGSGDDGFIGTAGSYMIRNSKETVVFSGIGRADTPQGASGVDMSIGGEIRVSWSDRRKDVETYALDEAGNRRQGRRLKALHRGGQSGSLSLLGRRRRCGAF